MPVGPQTNSLVLALVIGVMGSALALSFLYADWPTKARTFDANGNPVGAAAKQKGFACVWVVKVQTGFSRTHRMFSSG